MVELGDSKEVGGADEPFLKGNQEKLVQLERSHWGRS